METKTVDVQELFNAVLTKRIGYVQKYLESFEFTHGSHNDTIEWYGKIVDSDRHLRALVALGADSAGLPQPIDVVR